MLSGVLVPPIDSSVMPQDAQWAFTLITGIPMLIVLGIAIAHLIRGKGPMLLLCFIGGALSAFNEPVADIFCQLYFPRIGQQVAFETFGRPIPWFLVFAWPWYTGGQGYIAYRLFERGITRRAVGVMWFCFIIANILVETPGLLLGSYTYYGNQPFNYWGFPLWMGFVQSIMPMLVGAIIYAVRPHLGSGWRLLAVIPIVPMAAGMTYAGLALPIWSSLNSDMSLATNYVAAILTMCLSAFAVWMIAVMVARPWQNA